MPSDGLCTIFRMRLVCAVGVIGIWQAAAALGGPLPLTILATGLASLAGVWAIAALRDR
jgi:hypothetical protein